MIGPTDFSILLQQHISKLSRYYWSAARSVHHILPHIYRSILNRKDGDIQHARPNWKSQCRIQQACFVFGEVSDSNLGSDTTFLISSKDMLGTTYLKERHDRPLPPVLLPFITVIILHTIRRLRYVSATINHKQTKHPFLLPLTQLRIYITHYIVMQLDTFVFLI